MKRNGFGIHCVKRVADCSAGDADHYEAIEKYLAVPFQGGALADLLAIWLAGHPREYRAALLDHHLAAVRKLIPLNEPDEHK